jgi:hypothetical protein
MNPARTPDQGLPSRACGPLRASLALALALAARRAAREPGS